MSRSTAFIDCTAEWLRYFFPPQQPLILAAEQQMWVSPLAAEQQMWVSPLAFSPLGLGLSLGPCLTAEGLQSDSAFVFRGDQSSQLVASIRY